MPGADPTLPGGRSTEAARQGGGWDCGRTIPNWRESWVESILKTRFLGTTSQGRDKRNN